MARDRVNGIPRVDFENPPAWRRVLTRVANNKAVGAIHRRLVARMDAKLLRRTRGRLNSGLGLAPVLMLRTTGAKSGAVREVALGYFTDGDDVILIASNYGQAKYPNWYYNLLKSPQCELFARGGSGRFVARTTEGPDYDRLFSLAEHANTNFNRYKLSTAGVRTIPVFRLTPA